MASEFKGTKGEWKNNCFLVVATSRPGGLYGGQEICHTGGGRCNSEEAEANAELIAEAGTVLHTTGKTPRELAGEVERLTTERDQAIKMLADWCEAIDHNGTGWDDWDEHYKDAAYRPGPLRELLDTAIATAKEQRSSRFA